MSIHSHTDDKAVRETIPRRRFIGLALGAAAYSALPGFNSLEAQKGNIYDDVIIGGGMSGLTAAHLMKNHNILLLEKENVPGGRILGGEWQGFHYSMGASYTGEPDKEMRSFYKEIGVKTVPVPPPTDALAFKGKVFPGDYFENALGSQQEFRDYLKVSKELYKLSESGIEAATYAADIDKLARYEKLDQYSIGQWLERQKIGPVVQRYIDVENRGLFGAGNRDISFLFDIPEMAYNLYEEGVKPEDFQLRPVPDFHTYRPAVSVSDADLYTFRKGMIEMVWAIQGVKKLRGKIKTGAEVIQVMVNRDKTVTIAYRQQGRERTVKAYSAVITTPAPVTAAVVKNGFSANVMEALRSVPYTTYVTMALFLSRRLFRNAWNIACLDTCFTTLNDAVRTQVSYDYQGKSILGVAMPPAHAQDKSLLRMSDDALQERALKDIQRYFPNIRKLVLGRDIHRFKYAFPVFYPGYGEILWELHKDKSTKGPLFLAGDYMVYPTLGGAAASAWLAYEWVKKYAETVD
jgi:protoporphyrinogen oxidase